MTNALLIVDVQNDFIEGGTLAVTGGQNVALALAEYVAEADYDAIITTQDWHIQPGNHWAETPDYVDTWPVHCAANTRGAELRTELADALKAKFTANPDIKVLRVLKGEYEAAYSGFEGRNAEGGDTTVADLIKELGVTEIDVVGLATDHCVKATAQDALDAGFEVTVLKDFVAGVDTERSKDALLVLEQNGATIK